ncbi:MAG: ATP-binding protein [Fimbriimonas sp.]
MRSLRAQLIFSHLLIVALLGVVMTVVIASLMFVAQAMAQVVEDNLQAMSTCVKMELLVERQHNAIEFLARDGRTSARQDIGQGLTALGRDLASLANMVEPGEESEIFFQLQGDLSEYSARAVLFAQANELTQQPSALETVQRDLQPELAKIKDLLQRLRQVNEEQIVRANVVAQNSIQGATSRAVWIAGLSFLFAIVLAFRMVRLALAPLTILAKQAETIGSGDLSQKVRLGDFVEIGSLARSFNEMAERLGELRKSEVRRLHRAQRMSDAALENLYDPVIVTDGKGRIVFLNRAAEGLFGSLVETSPRVPLADHIQDQRIVRAVQHAIDAEGVSAREDEAALVRVRVGDFERTYRLRASPMKDEEVGLMGAVVVLEDITHLREVDRLKNEFIGVASHELRTPVTSMLISNELLEEGALGPLSPQQLDLVRMQKQDLQRLEALMRDLLDVTRLEAGVMPPRMQPVAPADLIRSVVNGQKNQAQDKGLILEYDAPADLPLVRADPSQIGRVLTNLIANAIRHTPSGGNVRVSAVDSGNVVTFSVGDSGEGIAPEYLEAIFERFVQVPGATQGGAGLGLSISRAIVKAHGGEMSVNSQLGKGSTFSFTLSCHSVSSEEQS